NELFHLGECDDLIEPARDLLPTHAENCSVQVDVLAAGQLRVEPGPHLKQTPHPAVDVRQASRRLGDLREDLEQRALPRPVAADDPDDLATLYFERPILERPEWRSAGCAGRSSKPPPRGHPGADLVPERRVPRPRPAQPVLLAEPFDQDGDVF